MDERLGNGERREDADSRGRSMVEKHFQKLQEEKEEAAQTKLQGLMPQFGQKVRTAALRETNWIPEKAALMLRRFHVANASKLIHLHKKRKRILNALTRAADYEEWYLSDILSSESESSERARSKKSRHKSKRANKKSKDKKSKKKKKVYSFGRYGVIKETDYHRKRAEFVKWAMEIRRIDTESMNRNDEMKLFMDFVEDFNTGTLPHVKYYDLEAYQKRKAEKKAPKDDEATGRDYHFNDEEARRREKEQKRKEDHRRRIEEAYHELKTSEKATDMKQQVPPNSIHHPTTSSLQELLRMQMKLAYKTGDTFTAGKLAERLKPGDHNDPGKADLLEEEEW